VSKPSTPQKKKNTKKLNKRKFRAEESKKLRELMMISPRMNVVAKVAVAAPTAAKNAIFS